MFIGVGLSLTGQLPLGDSTPPADVTAPTITSANPSGSYEEGVAIGGTLTANETATFSVTGTDAAAVTLDPDTGVWTLEETVFATQANYDFSFVATDAATNASDPQVVAITITEAVALATPTLTWTSGTSTYDPVFNMTEIANGDGPVEVEVYEDAGLTILYDTGADALIDAGEAIAGQATLAGLSTLDFSTQYWARGRYQRGGVWSDWSNTETKTMDPEAAPASADATDARSVLAGYIASYTWNDIDIGPADPDRYVWMLVWVGESDTVADVEVNATDAIKQDELATSNICLYHSDGPVPLGTTCSIKVAATGNTNQVVIAVGVAIGVPTIANVQKLAVGFYNEGSHELSVATPAGGKSLIFSYVEAASADGTWANAVGGPTGNLGGGVVRLCCAAKDAGTATVEVSGWGNRTSGLIAVNLDT